MLLFFLSLGSYLFYIILKYRKSIYMLQQNSYNTSNRYIKWVFKNYDKTLITEDFLFLIIYFLYYVIEFNFFASSIIFIPPSYIILLSLYNNPLLFPMVYNCNKNHQGR